MKNHFDCTLLYSDSDSFVYEIRSRDFFVELQKKQSVMDQFDFSNFPAEHPYTTEPMRVWLNDEGRPNSIMKW